MCTYSDGLMCSFLGWSFASWLDVDCCSQIFRQFHLKLFVRLQNEMHKNCSSTSSSTSGFWIPTMPPDLCGYFGWSWKNDCISIKIKPKIFIQYTTMEFSILVNRKRWFIVEIYRKIFGRKYSWVKWKKEGKNGCFY